MRKPTLKARPYQVEIANIARNESVIAKLNTGLGKTFIAVMVIKEHLPETFKPVVEGGKRIIFIAKTVHLVYQQADFLRSQLPVKYSEIGVFHGRVAPSVWIDSWTESIWRGQLEKHRILVITAGVLRDVLNHGKLSLRDVCLLIFDECHHADPDSKSDYADICQHLHTFPPGKWLPDYSRGPKVLGLSASLINNMKVGESLEVKIRRLEHLMRARVVTSTDSSITDVTGIRRYICVPYRLGGGGIRPDEPYYTFVQILKRGVETLERLSLNMPHGDECIDLETLLDRDKRINQEAFFSVLELHEFGPRKLKRILVQCIHVTQEFGAFCGVHACEQAETALQTLLMLDSSNRVKKPEVLRIIQACLTALSEAIEEYKTVHRIRVSEVANPLPNDPTSQLWGEWMAVSFPMSLKAVHLLQLLRNFRNKALRPQETLSILVLVKERITAAAVARLITDLSESTPLYAGLKASYCVSANPSKSFASMSTGDQIDTLEGFRSNKFNILVATTVVEEGLDVRVCNVVIKTDELTNFRSFIQSQGRARANMSYFVLMTDDEQKCNSRIGSFLQLEKLIGEALKGRCIDNLDEEEQDCDDVTEIMQTAYMPYGINGPRITASGATSVLMRYLSLLKTDTSYTLKILYSVKKEFGSYQVQLLMPPPSPLQEIITGPKASKKDLAKKLAKVEACKQLHLAGLLSRDLLPIDFRKLISISKNTNPSTRMDREEKRQAENEVVNAISRLSLGTANHDRLNVMSQASLLLAPLHEDIFTEAACLGDQSIIQGSSNITTDTGSRKVISADGEPRSGIVPCSPIPSVKSVPIQPRATEVKKTLSDTQKTPPNSKNFDGLQEIYDNHIIDDELPLECSRKRSSGRSLNKSRFYQVHRLYSLSSPYQEPIRAGRTCFLYTWRLPSPENVAICTRVNENCFRHTNQTIGWLFSKPISKSDFVCRVPLYMQFGMIRVRLRQTAKITLTEEQLNLAQRAHQILAEFTANANKPENFDLYFDPSGKHTAFYSTPVFSTNCSVLKPDQVRSAASSVNIINTFSQLQIDPERSSICCLFLTVKQPQMIFDEEASQALVTWADEREYYVQHCGPNALVPPPPSRNEPVRLRGGICPRYGVDLAHLPTSEWRGLIVRPVELPANYTGVFAVSGPNAAGLRGNSPVPSEMSDRLPENLRIMGHTTYQDYFMFKNGSIVSMVQEIRGMDASTPLVTLNRISRHRNAANVQSGVCAVLRDVSDHEEDRLSQLCVVHPLNSWLWLTICLTPIVLYQMYRCLSTCELWNRLHEMIYSDPGSSHSPELPEGNLLMPDRASAHLFSCPSLRTYLVKIGGDDGNNDPGGWQLKDPSPVYSCDEEEELDYVLLNKQKTEGEIEVPPTASLLEAFTTVKALEAVNLERLELLGDSLLKFASSVLLFATSPPTTDEGQLTYARGAYISNTNLHRIAVRHGLFRYLASCPFQPDYMYTPPYYAFADQLQARKSHDQRQFIRIYDKTISDSMESLLGVCLLKLSLPRVARLLQLFGLSNEPNPLAALNDPNAQSTGAYLSWVPLILDTRYRIIDPEFAIDDWESMSRRQADVERMLLENAPKTKISEAPDSPNLRRGCKDFYELLERWRLSLVPLEDIIGYRFRRNRILLQAITHPSSHFAFKWGCYQRLEFLGDAVLDFVVTQCIFRDHPNMDPGELTDLRMALVSNINLAVVCVRTGIYKFLLHSDNNLWNYINNFKKSVSESTSNIWHLEHYCSVRDGGLSYKVLGDMVEAIIGAIFVDCGGVTSIVTSVICNLLHDEMVAYGKELPTDPVRLLHESYPEMEITVVESISSESESDGDSQLPTRTTVKVMAKYKGHTITGEGFNIRTAKLQVAQQLGIGTC